MPNAALKRQYRTKLKKITSMELNTRTIMEWAGDHKLYQMVPAVLHMRVDMNALHGKVRRLLLDQCYGCRNKRLIEWYGEFAQKFRRLLFEARQQGDDLHALKNYLLERWRYDVDRLVMYYKDDDKVLHKVVI